MPAFLLLLGGGLLGTVIGYIVGQRKTTRELAGGMTNAAASVTGETNPGATSDGRWPGDPAYSPIPPAATIPATSSTLEAGGVPWYLESGANG